MSTLGLARERACFVPGNHDVSWPSCAMVRARRDLEEFSDAELERQLSIEKMVPWTTFLSNFHSATRSDVVLDFPALRLSVGLVDSCTRETDQKHGGHLAFGQAQRLMDELNHPGRADWLKLIAVHHNPVADTATNLREWLDGLASKVEANTLTKDALLHFAADATGFEGQDRLRAVCEDGQVQLVLHGHVHDANHTTWAWSRGAVGHTHIVGAGSWGLDKDKLPSDQKVMFQLLALEPHRQQVNVIRRVWEPRARRSGRIKAGAFVEDPTLSRGILSLGLSIPRGYRCP